MNPQSKSFHLKGFTTESIQAEKDSNKVNLLPKQHLHGKNQNVLILKDGFTDILRGLSN